MLTNPVIISVVVMIVLCVFKLNIMFAILVSAVVAGLISGLGLSQTMHILIGGMGGNSETALSYILLGALAVAINSTGVASLLAKKVSKLVGGKGWLMALFIAFISCFSQNLIPVHIAFIPILIPPLLQVMNDMKIDRRAIACALTFGLKAPYIVLPAGFGLIFQNLIRKNLSDNGMQVELNEVWGVNWILGLSMVIGLFIAIFFSYSKKREYQDLPIKGVDASVDVEKLEMKHYLAIIAAVIAFGVQLVTGSLPLGAMCALGFMTVTKTISWTGIEKVISNGVDMMGLIAFIMLVAAGYAEVIKSTNAIEPLVQGIVGLVGGSKFAGTTIMLLVGLFITMGIGTSFGTIPILATIYIPLCANLGISSGGTIVILSAASALGDAGSPASDSTLGPTSGLNADGQHDHIRDTCIPTFIHYNIPLLIAGMIGGMMF